MEKQAKEKVAKQPKFHCDKCRGTDFYANSNKKHLECNVCGKIWKRGDNIEADEQYARLGGQ